jgi:hypothetical protein
VEAQETHKVVLPLLLLHDGHKAQTKMASGVGRWTGPDDGQTIEDKKRELLRRIEEKKKNSSTHDPPLPTNNPIPCTPQSTAIFVNDGSFLARFQAMQKTKTASSLSTFPPLPPSKPSVSMKISTVKKNTITRPVLKRHDVFERESSDVKNGKLLKKTGFCNLRFKFLLTTKVFHISENLDCWFGSVTHIFFILHENLLFGQGFKSEAPLNAVFLQFSLCFSEKSLTIIV